MPKRSKLPGFRTHVRKGREGQRWVSYWLDMRGTGKPDIALGTDHAQALAEYHRLKTDRPRIAGTIEEAFQRWEREELPGYVNATTRRNYAQSLKTMRPVFGPATWDSVRVSTIAEYLKRRTAKTQANREKALLSVIWGKAREWELTALPFPAYKMRLSNPEKAQDVQFTADAFAAMYSVAVPYLRDAMDIASATGLRVRDIIALRLSDVRAGAIAFQSSKTGKRGAFDIAASPVLASVVERRKALKPPHLFLLTHGNRQVTERMLTDAWARARAKALPECPEVEGLLLRHLRKYAAQLAGSLPEAQALLQHGSAATTARHYRPSEKLRPVR
jgi:integrase